MTINICEECKKKYEREIKILKEKLDKEKEHNQNLLRELIQKENELNELKNETLQAKIENKIKNIREVNLKINLDDLDLLGEECNFVLQPKDIE